MITDHLTKIEYYRGLSPRIDQAIDFILLNDIRQLPNGRTEIDGDNLYVNRMYYTPSTLSSENKFEIHQRYIDIQIIVSGREGIALAPLDELTIEEERQNDDIAFYVGKPDHLIALRDNTFMLLFPGEAHMPGLAIYHEDASVDKIVFKVAY